MYIRQIYDVLALCIAGTLFIRPQKIIFLLHVILLNFEIELQRLLPYPFFLFFFFLRFLRELISQNFYKLQKKKKKKENPKFILLDGMSHVSKGGRLYVVEPICRMHFLMQFCHANIGARKPLENRSRVTNHLGTNAVLIPFRFLRRETSNQSPI